MRWPIRRPQQRAAGATEVSLPAGVWWVSRGCVLSPIVSRVWLGSRECPSLCQAWLPLWGGGVPRLSPGSSGTNPLPPELVRPFLEQPGRVGAGQRGGSEVLPSVALGGVVRVCHEQ